MDSLMRDVWDFGWDLLLPRFCFGCRKWRTYLCRRCMDEKVNYSPTLRCAACNRPATDGRTHPGCMKPWMIDGVYGVAAKNELLTGMIWEAKYHGAYRVLDPLGLMLKRQVPVWLEDVSIVIPVPLHVKRERERGFNQATILASWLVNAGIGDLKEDTVLRSVWTAPQATIEHKQSRANNVKGAFAAGPGIAAVQGKKVLVVDDVSTTGATLAQVAQVLKRNGAEVVWGLVVCH